MLEAAAAAAPEVGAGRLHAVRATAASMASMTPRPKRERACDRAGRGAIAGQAARDEDHVAVGPPDALAAEGEVVDGQGQNLPALGLGHGSDTINVGRSESICAPRSRWRRAIRGQVSWIARWARRASPSRSAWRRCSPPPCPRSRSACWPSASAGAGARPSAPTLARRSRPGELGAGTLTVVVDNSPWLQELTHAIRGESSTARPRPVRPDRHARCASSLAGPAPARGPPDRRAAPRRAAPAETRRRRARASWTAPPRRCAIAALASTVRRHRGQGPASRAGAGPLPGAPARRGRARRLRRPRRRASTDRAEARPTAPTIAAPVRRRDRRPGRGLLPLLDRADGGPRRPDAGGHRPAARGHQARSQHRGPLDPALPVAGPRPTTPRAPSTAAQKAVALEPNNAGAHMTLADLYQRQRKLAEAEAELEQVIALDPQTPDALPGARPAALRAEELRQGARGAAAAGRPRARTRPGHYLLGRIAHRDRAVGRGHRPTQARGRARPRPRRRVVGARLRLREPRTSSTRRSRSTRQALKANPDNPAFVERLGDLLVRLGRFERGAERDRALAESRPRDPRVWMKLGAIHYEQKQWDAAVAAFRRPSRSSPATCGRATSWPPRCMDAGKDDEARIELEKILRADPALGGRARPARLPLRPGQALRRGDRRRCSEAVNLEPKRPELFLYLGTALYRANQYDRAADGAAGRALGSTTRTRICTSSSAWCYEKQQRFDDAISRSAA